MERFAFKIDKVLKANLYKICRLCGIDNPEKVPIVQSSDNEIDIVDADAEPELSQKIKDLIGITVYKDDKMPQFVCTLCVDKINDFYEFREMCFSTDQQTRKLLGIKALPSKTSPIKLEVKNEPADKRGKKRRLEDLDIKEEVDKINSKKTNSQPIHLNKKKKLRLADGTFKTNSNIMPLTKKQGLKQRALFQSANDNEFKTEIKDEPSVNELTSAVAIDNAQKLKQLCDICYQRFPTKNKLERHRNSAHNPNIAKFFCNTCNDEVVKSNDIKSHQLWHKLSKTPYTCGLCEESLLTVNLFTRHLSTHTQKLLTPIVVFDRECSLCHETFVTNFLYNTHPCALRTKKCGGCNRKVKTDIEYQMHASYCEKAYLVPSKHICCGNEAVRIKNENDVEAAVENFDTNISVPSTMKPVVSLTRLSIEPNQKVNVASTSAAAAAAATAAAEATHKSKKSSKKGISKKDLKRVDDLLKSTMDTLVSIKHEPEINVDAEPHASTPQPETQQHLSAAANDDEHMEHEADSDGMHFDDDDFQNQDDDSNHSGLGPNVQMHASNSFTVKQEPADDLSCDEQQQATDINTHIIKKEIPDNAATPSKMPVLKLKITKEHGTLNSSLVNENKDKSERKKKKKKRREAEKAAADMATNLQENALSAANSADDSTDKVQCEPRMPIPGVVHIKQERIDDEYFEERATAQPTCPIMTSIPIMQFQIACVSSGVEFDKGDANKETAPHDAVEAATQEAELPDVKPNREELDRLLSANTTNTAEHEDTTRQRRQLQKTARKSVATKSTSHRKFTNDKTKTPLEQIPKIVAVSSGIDLPSTNNENATTAEFVTQVRIKAEPRDDYDNEATAEPMDYHEDESAVRATVDQLASEEPLFDTPSNSTIYNAQHTDEQAYINSIDFNNVRIKQEKDIDVSESQLTAPHFSHVSALNGSVSTNNDEEGSGSAAVENEELENEEEEYDDEDYYAEGTEMPGEEVREYREIDWPPLLSEAANETLETSAAPQIDKPSFGLTIANVCSQAAVSASKQNANSSSEAANLQSTISETVDSTTQLSETATTSTFSTKIAVNHTEAHSPIQLKASAEVVNNDVDEVSSDTISGQTTESAEVLLEAQPVSVNKTKLAEIEAPADVDSTASIDEEQQNILNHEMCDSLTNSATLNTPTDDQAPTNALPNLAISNVTSTQHESYLEDISSNSCSFFSSIGNENSTNVAETPAASVVATATSTAPTHANHEETENLYNENIDAALNLRQQSLLPSGPHSQLNAPQQLQPQQQQQHALLIDNSNVNEIAENNNNANIERELLDDVRQNVDAESSAANESLPSTTSQPSPTT